MTEKVKSLSPVISQMVLRNLGMYCSERLSIDQYYLMEAINLLVSDIGEAELEKMYKKEGKKWEDTKIKLEMLNKLLVKTKTFYDPIQNKNFDKKKVDPNKAQIMFKKYFIKTASKIALMQRELYDIFVFLVKNTTLQMQQISSEAFKVLEHVGFRKMDLTKKTPPTSPGGST